MAISPSEQSLVFAMELLRRQLQDNALGIAANTQATEADLKLRANEISQFLSRNDPKPTKPAEPPRPLDPHMNGNGSGPVIKVDVKLPPQTDASKGDIVNSPNQKALNEFHDGRREDNAKKALESAQKAERTEKLRGLGGGAGGAIMDVLSQVAGKFAAIIGPAAILGQILNSTVSGFGVLQQSVRVFASTLAPILLPATLMLSGVFLSLSEIVEEHSPLMELFFEKCMMLVPILEIVIDMADGAADAIQDMADAAEDFSNWMIRRLNDLNTLNPFSDDLKESHRDDAPSVGEDKVDRGMRDTLQALRQSIGPRGSVSALGGVGQAAQQAALNQDPLEARLLKQMNATLDRMDAKMAKRERKRPGRVYDPNAAAGIFIGDAGAGGGMDDGGDL